MKQYPVLGLDGGHVIDVRVILEGTKGELPIGRSARVAGNHVTSDVAAVLARVARHCEVVLVGAKKRINLEDSAVVVTVNGRGPYQLTLVDVDASRAMKGIGMGDGDADLVERLPERLVAHGANDGLVGRMQHSSGVEIQPNVSVVFSDEIARLLQAVRAAPLTAIVLEAVDVLATLVQHAVGQQEADVCWEVLLVRDTVARASGSTGSIVEQRDMLAAEHEETNDEQHHNGDTEQDGNEAGVRLRELHAPRAARLL